MFALLLISCVREAFKMLMYEAFGAFVFDGFELFSFDALKTFTFNVLEAFVFAFDVLMRSGVRTFDVKRWSLFVLRSLVVPEDAPSCPLIGHGRLPKTMTSVP